MDNDDNKLMNKLKNSIKIVMKTLIGIAIRILLPVIIIIIILAGVIYFITIDDGTYKEDDWGSVPFASSQYTGNASISSDGKITSSNTPQEIWDKSKEEDGRANLYLDNAEQLAKLMNAEVVTQFLDTRANPDEPIDWDSINKPDSKELQGIIKLKRANSEGNTSTMTYADPETFQDYIDKYNDSGSEADRNKALSHFTIEKTSLSSTVGGQVTTIEAGTTIKVKEGLGSVHTYMGWQKITSPSSTQYKLREQAGMNFDEEGFGKINGRYVIACTTTFGKVGDYIDFYQEDGTIISCIIGDIKSRSDAGCTKWGHDNGHCIVEFIVDKDSWYNSNHPNPGTTNFHPEWNKNITKAVNGGSYFDNPNFGTDKVTESGKSTENDSNEDAMKWPTEGINITSNYGPRNSPTEGASSNHKGIDIDVAEGTNVYACEDGKVTTATTSSSAGNYIVIDHGNGYVSKYMHNNELNVKAGDKVKKGDIIALSGNTGVSTGAHLHFQIEKDGSPVDPLTFKYDNDMGAGDGGIGSDSKNIESNQTKYYAKVATWSETTDIVESNDPNVQESSETIYNMTTTNINYQDFVSGYTMPFDYLWALLVIGEDKNFILQLADLVYGSEIEITVHDNLTINTNVKEDRYTKETKTDTEGQVTVTYGNQFNMQNDTQKDSWSDSDQNTYTTKTTNINKNNTLDISLTRANVWIVDYIQEYIYQKPESNTVSNDKKVEDEEFKNSPDSHTNEDKYGHVNKLLQDTVAKHSTTALGDMNNQQNNLNNNENSDEENIQSTMVFNSQIDNIDTKIYNRTINRVIKTTNTTETSQYVSSPAKIIEKTDKNAEEDNFVTILLKDECKKAKKLILQVSSWLYEILESNEKTENMVDLTKYLLYKATNKDYGVKEYDFSAYDPSNFVTVGDDAKSNLEGVPGQIADFFLEKGISIEGVAAILGNIQQECNFNSSDISSPDYYGGYHGLCQWGNYKGDSNGRFAQLEKLAKNEGTDWTDVNTQLKFIWKELNSSGYYAVKNNLMNSTDAEKSAEYFARHYEKCINKDGTIQQLDERKKYAKQWLKELQDKCTGGSSLNIDTSSFLATAKSCHDYLRENNYWYPSQANLNAGKYVSDGAAVKHKFPTKGEDPSKRYIDCSAYVSWVLKEYGYNLSSPYTARGLLSNPLHLQEISVNNVKAGDILVRDGHTEIYCGDGKSYNCGSTSAIRSQTSNCNPSKFTKAFRVNK